MTSQSIRLLRISIILTEYGSINVISIQYTSSFKIVKNAYISFMHVYTVLKTYIKCVVRVILPERYNANERVIKYGGRELTRKAQISTVVILFTRLVGLVELLLKKQQP